jgi:hypothetical protein
MTYYECIICETINSSLRLSCQNCGTIPQKYSAIKKPCRLVHDDLIEVVRAKGFMSAYPSHAKIGLRTVPAGYYATE